ncbi:MAG: hypothetical protein AB3N20_08190 [Rhizobiaceae bacterium]
MRIFGSAVVALTTLFFGPGYAADIQVVETPAPVQQLVKSSDGVFVKTNAGSFRLKSCAGKPVCLTRSPITGELPTAPDIGLPDGQVAVAAKGDLRRAWYGRPTRRYGHAVLGDDLEAGSLVAEDDQGRHYELLLDRSYVFEDITPRIFDLDRDGHNEIITIRSSLNSGAAIAIYGLEDGALKLLAATPEIGRSHRWLNIAGIGDFPGAGVNAIAWVETPHIGGVLRMGVFNGRDIEIFSNSYRGFSNHFIGSRELGLSAIGDFNGDGVPDLAIPSAGRASMVIATRLGLTSIELPGRVGHAVAAIGNRIVTADTEGNLIVIHP